MVPMICAWNVRGFNDPFHVSEARRLISTHRLALVGLLETKVRASVELRSQLAFLSSWRYVVAHGDSGTGRIWVCWDPDRVGVDVIDVAQQWIHVRASFLEDDVTCQVTFAYGLNEAVDRRPLWSFLRSASSRFRGEPWCVIGDMNAVRSPHERSGGDMRWYGADEEFDDVIRDAELEDLQYTGEFFTWMDCREVAILRKLDRALVNARWLEDFSDSTARFLLPGCSDHSPCLVSILQRRVGRRVPFKFFEFWTEHPQFRMLVDQAWSETHDGRPMYVLYRRLSALKGKLKKLNRDVFSGLSTRVDEARTHLEELQSELLALGSSGEVAVAERAAATRFNLLARLEESMVRQKARVRWLQLGDRNTAFFFSTLKRRHNRNAILSLTGMDGQVLSDPTDVMDEIVRYFSSLFSAVPRVVPIDEDMVRSVLSGTVTEEQAVWLSAPVTSEEVRSAMFHLGRHKAPGPDGYTAEFFRESWDVVGELVTDAVQDFFVRGRLLREANTTIISLIPKKANPTALTDFRPISCCNTVYKCITRILASRVREVLPGLIGSEQSAFIPGRRIVDNIMLAHELIRGYHTRRGPARCAMKIDIRKAYDSVEWDFLRVVLHCFGFPDPFVHRIMECVTTARFSVNVNGELQGFFPSSRGLRQGDPLSPYLFVMVMEVLSGMLRRVTDSPEFGFHSRCKKVRLSHLCFADDLLIFSSGRLSSVRCVMETLSQFGAQSGLRMNVLKSEIYFGGVSEDVQTEILEDSGFTMGELPVRYLGVPLITMRLTSEDCAPLVDAIASRIRHWTSRHLSYAGRLQLVSSVLFATQTYWSSVFPIPKAVCYRLEQLLSRFLWSGPSLDPHKTKVAWEKVCRPKEQGGLGLKRITEWNRAAMMKHIWHLFSDPEDAVWARWVRTYLLRGESFWHVKQPDSCSWIWRRLLILRHLVRQLISWRMGDGSRISFWYDSWSPSGPLVEVFGRADIERSRTPDGATVEEFFADSSWRGYILGEAVRIHRHRRAFFDRVRELVPDAYYPVPGTSDCVVWVPCSGGEFSISSALRYFCRVSPVVPWADFVWSKGMLPRCSFVVWLLVQGRLYTSDILFRLGVVASSTCALCGSRRETVDHLFFLCSYSAEVWIHTLSGLLPQRFPRTWSGIRMMLFSPAGGSLRRRTAFTRMMGACIYYIWMERNKRRVGERRLPPRTLASIISASLPRS